MTFINPAFHMHSTEVLAALIELGLRIILKDQLYFRTLFCETF